MTGGIEQMLYSWVPRGPDGRAGWQVIGRSPGLSVEMANLVVRFCTCPQFDDSTTISDKQVSFGWWDNGDFRIAFHRQSMRLPGVTNNFAGHYLIGMRSSLPAIDLLRSYTSDFWWRSSEAERIGEVEFSQLQSLTRLNTTGAELIPLPSTTLESASRLLPELLSTPASQGVVMDLTSDQIVATLLRLSEAVPELVNETSVSTIWGAEDPFCKLVGMRNGRVPSGYIQGAEATISDELKEVADATLDESDRNRELVRAARQSAHLRKSTRFNRRDYCEALLSLLALEDDNFTKSAVTTAVSNPAGANLAINNREGVKIIANAILDVDGELLSNLKSSYALGEVAIEPLAQALWRTFVDRARYDTLGVVARTLDELSLELKVEFFKYSLIDDDETVWGYDVLSKEDIYQMLVISSRQHIGVHFVSSVLERTRLQKDVSTQAELPLAWRAQALCGGLANHSISPEFAVGLVAENPELARKIAPAMTDTSLLCEMVKLSSSANNAAELAHDFVASDVTRFFLDVVLTTLERLPKKFRYTFLQALPSSSERKKWFDEWDQVLSRCFALEISAELEVSRPALSPSFELVSLANRRKGPRAKLWMDVLDKRGATYLGRRINHDQLDEHSLIAGIATLPVLEQQTCAHALLFGHVRSRVPPQELAIFIREVSNIVRTPSSRVCRSLMTSTSSSAVPPIAFETVNLVAAIICLVNDGAVGPGGNLPPDAKLDRAVAEKAASFSDSDRQFCGSIVQGAARQTKKWWRGVSKDSRWRDPSGH